LLFQGPFLANPCSGFGKRGPGIFTPQKGGIWRNPPHPKKRGGGGGGGPVWLCVWFGCLWGEKKLGRGPCYFFRPGGTQPPPPPGGGWFFGGRPKKNKGGGVPPRPGDELGPGGEQCLGGGKHRAGGAPCVCAEDLLGPPPGGRVCWWILRFRTKDQITGPPFFWEKGALPERNPKKNVSGAHLRGGDNFRPGDQKNRAPHLLRPGDGPTGGVGGGGGGGAPEEGKKGGGGTFFRVIFFLLFLGRFTWWPGRAVGKFLFIFQPGFPTPPQTTWGFGGGGETGGGGGGGEKKGESESVEPRGDPHRRIFIHVFFPNPPVSLSVWATTPQEPRGGGGGGGGGGTGGEGTPTPQTGTWAKKKGGGAGGVFGTPPLFFWGPGPEKGTTNRPPKHETLLGKRWGGTMVFLGTPGAGGPQCCL